MPNDDYTHVRMLTGTGEWMRAPINHPTTSFTHANSQGQTVCGKLNEARRKAAGRDGYYFQARVVELERRA